MSEQTVPPFEIQHHGRTFKLIVWDREEGEASYIPIRYRHGCDEVVTAEWQDENRTWLTIDEVYATRWDCCSVAA